MTEAVQTEIDGTKKGSGRRKIAKNPDLEDAKMKMKKSAEAADALADVTQERETEARTRLKHVRALREKDAELWVELAEELFEINSKALFHHMMNPATSAKYSSFKEFALQETWFGSERTAAYLIAIWDYFVIKEGEGDRTFLDSVKHLGWSKLKEMINYMTTENLVEVMSFVESTEGVMSVNEVKDMVRDSKQVNKKEKDPASGPAPGDTKREKLSQVSYRLFDHQKENLELAIEKAKKIRDTEANSEALEIIALDFMSMHVNEDKEDMTDIMRGVEVALNGTVLVFRRNDVYYLGKNGEMADTKAQRTGQLFQAIEDKMDVVFSVIKDGKLIHAPGMEEGASDVSNIANTLASLEEALGVKLIAHKEGEGFLFGAETLKKLAEDS
jgi:hypothetical protein